MTMFNRPAPSPAPAAAQLAAVQARVDQAVTHLDAALRLRHRLAAAELVDVLLEVRHALIGKHEAANT